MWGDGGQARRLRHHFAPCGHKQSHRCMWHAGETRKSLGGYGTYTAVAVFFSTCLRFSFFSRVLCLRPREQLGRVVVCAFITCAKLPAANPLGGSFFVGPSCGWGLPVFATKYPAEGHHVNTKL